MVLMEAKKMFRIAQTPNVLLIKKSFLDCANR